MLQSSKEMPVRSMRDDKDIWFPAKRYGWGWGLPITWQGWVVFLIWLACLVAGLFFIRPNTHSPLAFAAFVLMMTALLIGVCLWKGEKPRWRWGE